jgi:hypothetical protein
MFLLQLKYGFNLHSEKKRPQKKYRSAFILLLLFMARIIAEPLKRT